MVEKAYAAKNVQAERLRLGKIDHRIPLVSEDGERDFVSVTKERARRSRESLRVPADQALAIGRRPVRKYKTYFPYRACLVDQHAVSDQK